MFLLLGFSVMALVCFHLEWMSYFACFGFFYISTTGLYAKYWRMIRKVSDKNVFKTKLWEIL